MQFIPYLAFGCDSVDFNVERVRGYMANLCDVCGTNDDFRLTGSFGCDCPPLLWDPYTTNVDNPQQAIPIQYTNPAGNNTVLTAQVIGAEYGGNGYVTFTADNTFEAGQIITISGIPSPENWLNCTHFVIVNATPTTFSGYVPCTVCDNTDPVVTTVIGTTWVWDNSGSYLSGTFLDIDGVTSPTIGFVDNDGNVDSAFSTNAGTGLDVPPPNCIAVQPDGKALIGGYFGLYDGVTSNYLVRINTDGTLDAAFTAAMGAGFDGDVQYVAVQPDGKIVCVGNFTSFDGNYSEYVVVLNADGSWYSGFQSTGGNYFDNYTDAVAVEADGKILIATSSGSIDYDGNNIDGMTRLNPDGTFHSTFPANGSFHNGFDTEVQTILVQPDGKIVVGGDFINVNNLYNAYIVRFNVDGTVDSTYSTAVQAVVDYTVYALSLQSNGKVVVGGDFTGYIKRFNTDGTEDTAFTTALGTGFNGPIYALTVRNDGKILVGGLFTEFDGTTVNRIALLNADGTLNTAYTTNIGTGIQPGGSDVSVIGLNSVASPATATLHVEEAAPWYDPDIPASARFLGYVIEQFSGLESPVKREIVPKMSGSGGGIFGPYRNAPRQFQISALMFACDQEAMDYGFQYLKDALGYWACSKCETCDIEFATACQTFDTFANGYYQPPSPSNVLRNRWNVYNVGLVEGPMYGEDPIPRVACNLRRVQFILAAEDPWLYHCESDQGTFDLGLTGDSATDENTLHTGSSAPTATITAVSATGSLVTYTAINSFRTNDVITITGLTPDGYNLTNATVQLATSTYFTVESTVTGVATIPPNGTATLVARAFEHVQPIVSAINIGEIAVNVTITNPSNQPTYDVAVSLYPDNLGYKYWQWQGITGTAGYATSTTSLTIGYGTSSFTTQSGMGWAVGARLRAVSDSTINAWMEGTVVSYTGTTLLLDVDSMDGEGLTYDDWNIGKPIPAGWETPSPCARVVVGTIPAGYTFEIDSSRETYTLISDSGETYDGTPYIKVEPGNIPEFLTARCGTYALGVSGSYTGVGQGTTVTVETQHREL